MIHLPQKGHVKVMKISKMLILSVFCIFAVYLAACSGPLAGGEHERTATIRINLGGISRQLVDIIEGEHLLLSHKLVLISQTGVTVERDLKHGPNEVSVPAGTWLITVHAYDGTVLRGLGEADDDGVPIGYRTLAPNDTESFDVNMVSVMEINSWDAINTAINSPGEASRPIILLLKGTAWTASSPVTVSRPTTLLADGNLTITRAQGFIQSLFTINSTRSLTLGGNLSRGNLEINGGGFSVANPLISVPAGSTLVMNSGVTLSNNNNTSGAGGAVSIVGGAFIMNDGTINDNAATSGGGVNIAGGNFIMEGGVIEGNTAAMSGGGVNVDTGTFTMRSGTIRSNSTGQLGSAINIGAAQNFNKTGGTIFGYGSPGANTGGTDHIVNLALVPGTTGPLTRTFTLTDGDNLSTTTPGSGWDGGTGTVTDPFRIFTEGQLRVVGRSNPIAGWNLSAHYRLETNITLTGNWTPIGTTGNRFTGTFDGNNRTITGMNVGVNTDSGGMFYQIGAEGTVENFILANAIIELQSTVGAVAGENYGIIENITVSNLTIDGTSGTNLTNIGGLVGINRGSISNSSVTGTIRILPTTQGEHSNIGGLVGTNQRQTPTASEAIITGSFFRGNVTGSGIYIGGIAGTNQIAARITNSYAAGNVTGMSYSSTSSRNVGGLAGQNITNGVIEYSFAVNDVDAGGSGPSIGGIVGHNDQGEVRNSLALNPNITGDQTSSGRIIGGTSIAPLPNLINNFGLATMTLNSTPQQPWSFNTVGMKNGVDVAPAQLREQSFWAATGPNGPGFSFNLSDWVWNGNNGMPSLRGIGGQILPWPPL